MRRTQAAAAAAGWCWSGSSKLEATHSTSKACGQLTQLPTSGGHWVGAVAKAHAGLSHWTSLPTWHASCVFLSDHRRRMQTLSVGNAGPVAAVQLTSLLKMHPVYLLLIHCRLGMEILTGDFKQGLSQLLAQTHVQAIVLGTRR